MSWKPGDYALMIPITSAFKAKFMGEICQLIEFLGEARNGKTNTIVHNAWKVDTFDGEYDASESILHPIPKGRGDWKKIEHIWKPKVLETVGERSKL